jgi:integrase
MKTVRFTYTLDCTFKKGVDHRMCAKDRMEGKNVDVHYFPRETGVYLSWSFAGKYMKEYTTVNILPVLWDWRLKLPVRKHPNHLELSTLLSTILSKVQREYLRMRTDGIALTGDSISQMVRCVIHGDHTSPEKALFWKVFDEFIEEKKLLSAPATVVKYETLRKHLLAYEKIKGVKLTLEDINMIFHNGFMVYCIGLGFRTNTVGKLVAMIKAFMNYAYDRKFTRNLEFKKFKVRSETTEPVFLTMEELQAIEKFDSCPNSSLAISRDVFVFGSVTGQRISDLLSMKKKDIKKAKDGELWWEVHQVKTRKVVRVFLIDKARKILDVYLSADNLDGFVFPSISPVVINRNLKVIGKAAGLTAEVTKVNYCGNKKLEVTGPKYMFLTTHVARKTFITALSASNMPDHEIQMLSGHSSVKELKVYKGRNADSIRNQMIALFEPISIVKSA